MAGLGPGRVVGFKQFFVAMFRGQVSVAGRAWWVGSRFFLKASKLASIIDCQVLLNIFKLV